MGGIHFGVLAAIAGAAALAGCSGAHSHIGTYVEPANYDFSLTIERPGGGEYRIHVRDHAVTGFDAVDTRSQNALDWGLVDASDMVTLADIVSAYVDARDGGAASADLRWNDATGQPLYLTVDPDAAVIDDEWGYVATYVVAVGE